MKKFLIGSLSLFALLISAAPAFAANFAPYTYNYVSGSTMSDSTVNACSGFGSAGAFTPSGSGASLSISGGQYILSGTAGAAGTYTSTTSCTSGSDVLTLVITSSGGSPSDALGVGTMFGIFTGNIALPLVNNFPLVIAILAALTGLGILVFYVRKWVGRK